MNKPYQGHKNRNCWNVALWLHNDEKLYQLVTSTIKNMGSIEAAISPIMCCLPSHTPDGVKYTKSNVRAALTREDK